MDTDSTSNEQKTDFEAIKTDLKNLYEHVSSALSKKSVGARASWDETRASLDEKRKILEEKASKLASSGSAASEDVRVGFVAAFDDLKRAYQAAKKKFEV